MTITPNIISPLTSYFTQCFAQDTVFKHMGAHDTQTGSGKYTLRLDVNVPNSNFKQQNISA